MNEKKLRKQGYIRIDKFLRSNGHVGSGMPGELPGDGEHTLWFRKQFREHWGFIRLTIAKS